MMLDSGERHPEAWPCCDLARLCVAAFHGGATLDIEEAKNLFNLLAHAPLAASLA
ncbi:MAG TPA: hypothetical protein VJT16_03005 [Streptosporangiaceae bacterium]|nr:hypothetical protein [Streptosporangiaceae bacterium]